MRIIKKSNKKFYYRFKKADGGLYLTIIILIGTIIQMMRQGYSPIILICGGQRKGKSFFALWLLLKVMRVLHVNYKFNIKINTFYDPEDIIIKLKDMEEQGIIIDEAGDIFNKMEYYTKICKAFDKIIQTQGYKTNLYIFVAPFGLDIAKTFRKHFHFTINMKERGFGIVRRVPKKYDLLADKPLHSIFVESIKINKNAIPSNIWDKYEKYSIEQKEIIRQRQEDKLAGKDNIRKDPFGNPIPIMSEVYNA